MEPIFTDLDQDHIDEAGVILQYILIFCFGILLFACVVVAAHSLLFLPWNIVKLLKLLLPWPPLAREVALLYNLNTVEYMTEPVSSQTPGNAFLSGAPGYFLFSVYLLLVLFWAYLYHSKENNGVFMKQLLLTFVVINTFVYTIWITLIILMAIYPDYSYIFHATERTFAVIIDISICIIFLIYGIRLLYVLNNNGMPPNFISKRIFTLTSFCSISFLFRSIWIICYEFLFTASLITLFGNIIDYVFCEFIPILFILIVLCWPTYSKEFKTMKHKTTYYPLQ